MTTTDQAFIKAYLHDDGEQVPPPPHIPVYGSQQVPVGPSPAVSGELENRSAGPIEATEIDTSNPPLQPPVDPYTQRPGDEPSVANTRIDEPTADPVPVPHASFPGEIGGGEDNEDTAADSGAVAAQPLSSFMSTVDTDITFRPALAVDRFLWPTITEKLIRHVGPGLAEVARRLVEAARAGQQVVAIAGCQRREGRTTTLLGIARELARVDAKVVLVDADFQRPQLAKRLGLAVEYGWEAVLRGELPLAEAVVRAESNGLTLLPLREPIDCESVEGAEQLAGSLQVSVGMAVLRKNFELVLIDLGPILDPAAALFALPLAIEARIDAAVLVHDARRARADELAAASKRLAEARVTTLGIVENFARIDHLPAVSTKERAATAV